MLEETKEKGWGLLRELEAFEWLSMREEGEGGHRTWPERFWDSTAE